MNSRHWKTLISALELQQQLHDGQLVIVDCRSDASDPDAGYRAYQTAHLPGAVYAHLNHDLSGPISRDSGRHPLPDIKTLSTKLGNWGIDRSKQVIAYDADNGAMAAARLWWLLRWLGHERVAVLDGGIKHWQASGFELVSSSFVPAIRSFMPEVNSSWVMDADTVAAHATQADWCVLDARAPERFAGEVEPLDAVAGHVPGARNHFFLRNLDGNGRFLPASKLRQQFTEVAAEVASHQIINMCGSGVTACHNLLAMEVAGLHGARLYAGSWSEWTRQHRPVATGK